MAGDEVRVESSGIGIVTATDTESITIRSIPKRELISGLFGCFGMTAETSPPGRIATRLIRQMGGIHGCRVFKIRGVRDLIETYSPLESFTRQTALQIIGPRFSAYEDLYIEPGQRGPLKPEHAFQFLLKKGVFQTGLKLLCPNCELDFWMSLDDIASEVKCEYCGSQFAVAPQLKDRPWAYRRSGLFGRENNQEGSIPVVLTLQQLQNSLHSNLLFVTGTNISSSDGQIRNCETDFVAVQHEKYNDTVSLVIGECKTRGDITDQDAENMACVADAFRPYRVRVFIVFSKLAEFTESEIELLRRAQPANQPRIIMFSGRELEPFRPYDGAPAKQKLEASPRTLEGMAQVTRRLYLRPSE